jgi:TusA-related sulfurtransferase
MALPILLHKPNTGVLRQMSEELTPTETLDVRGLSCPMPVVQTGQAVDGLSEGDVLEVQATDSGSVSDIAGWAESTEGVELRDQDERTEDGETVYLHYVELLA